MRTVFTIKLFDDESVKEKLKVMHPLEAMFDDARNIIPEEYWEIVGKIKLGQSLTVIVESKE